MMFDLQEVVLLLKLEASYCQVRSSRLAFTFTGATEHVLTHQNSDLTVTAESNDLSKAF